MNTNPATQTPAQPSKPSTHKHIYRGKAYRAEGFEGGAPDGTTVLDVINEENSRGKEIDVASISGIENEPASMLLWVGRSKKQLMDEYGPKEDVGYRGLIGSDANISDVTKQVVGKRIIHEDETGVLVYLGDQTKTTEFRRWFGDSKVVDVEGKPLVVYHGTEVAIERFKRGDEGIFFTTSPKVASAYAMETFEPDFVSGGENVVPVYLQIRKPLTITPIEYLQGQTNDGLLLGDEVEVRRRRYDGFRITPDPELDALWDGDTWVVFRPEQIKSAIGNRGTFDPRDPNILR